MSDQAILREKARELIRAGRLPSRRPERLWGGIGFGGSRCVLCGAPVRYDEIALQLEVKGGNGAGVTYPHLHVRCFSALELELQSPDPQGGPGLP
jgi:hypothetical protein